MTFSNILFSIISEIKCIGKKLSIVIMSPFAILFGILSLIFKSYLYIFFTISTIFQGGLFNIYLMWSCILLPTKIRDTGVGLFIGMSRIGGFISQFVVIELVYLNIDIPILIYIISAIISVILVIFLPKKEVEELDSSLGLTLTITDIDDDDKDEVKNK
jgi:hypothetical protein